MIRPEDISEAVRFLLQTSPYCVVPEIVFQRPGEASLTAISKVPACRALGRVRCPSASTR